MSSGKMATCALPTPHPPPLYSVPPFSPNLSILVQVISRYNYLANMLEIYIPHYKHIDRLRGETDAIFCAVSVSHCVLGTVTRSGRPPVQPTQKQPFQSARDKRKHPCVFFLSDISTFTRFAIKAHTYSCPPPKQARSLSEEHRVSKWVCNRCFGYSLYCCAESSLRQGVLPTAEIACGTGMQYGPQQSILVSICQNTIFPFYNADC